MKKYLLKSFALIAMLFSAMTLSAASGVDWSAFDFIGDGAGGGAYANKYKVQTVDGLSVVNIQKPGFANEAGIYLTVPAGISNCTVNGAIQGAGMVLYLSSLTAKETEVTITHGTGSCTFWVYYADGTEGGGEELPDTEAPTLISVELFGAAQNFVLLSPNATDNKGVTSYLITPNGGAEKEVTLDNAGKIKIEGLTLDKSYTYSVKAKDAAGNVSDAKEITFSTLDRIFCEEEVLPNVQFTTNQKLTFTAKKVSNTETLFTLTSSTSTLTKMYNVNLTNAGSGVLPAGYVWTNDWTLTDNTLSKTVTWETYPTNPITIAITANRTPGAGESNLIGLSYSMDISNTCGEEPTPDPTPDPEPETPTEIYDTNFALVSNGASAEASSKSDDANLAIDGNEGSRWGSEYSDPQTWILDLGQLRIFNTLEIVWEGAYGKTFTVSVSDDKETWTPVWTVEGQELAGFPYTQTQKIDKTTGRYIQFHGTARGTGYGYSFWEFRVYLAGTSTLTTLEAKPATNLTKLGEGNAITLTPKDQNGQTMAGVGEVTYTITPADAGTITDNVYIPAKIGPASIVAAIGEVKAAAFEVFGYAGENVALSTSINSSKIVAQSDFAPSGTDAWHAIDGNEGSVWQGSATNGTADDEASRTYDSWFVVDFGAEYDVNLVSIKFEGACSQEYTVAFSADNAVWATAYEYVGNAVTNGHTKLIYGNDLQNNTKVRYARFYSTKAATKYGMKIFEFQVFGTESASLTKAVSASVNDAGMGTATVTQNGVAVTEVETGSEVTFTATANEGHIFVNWSNGNTNPSFTTTVDAPMDLTANFRALGNIYCNTEMTVDGHTIYVTMKRSAPETYQLIVRSKENLTNFGGTNFYRSNNIHVIDLRDQGVLSEDKHILTATFTAETAPYMGTPLYVIFEGVGEITYSKLDNIEYDVECSEDVTVTGLAIDPASVSVMVGGSQTLKAIFTPAHAFGEELEWISSKDAIATVAANGLVTAIAEGEAVITATLVSNPAISATCNVTVTPFIANTFYGNGSDGGVDFAYSLTTNANGTITIVADVFTNNPGLATPSFSIDGEWKDMTKNADGTYTRTSEKTFSVGQEVACFLYAPYTGGAARIDFTYIVGSSNERPTITVESVTLDKTTCDLMPTETAQLVATVNPTYATNKSVTWTSSNNNVATVDANGLVTAKSAGTAIITVTTADGGKTATCTIAVVAALTDAIYYANDFFTINGQLVGFNYAITRTPERKLRYEVAVNGEAVVDGTPVEFNIRLNDGVWNDMTKEGTGHFTFESSRTYNDNDPFVGFFYAVYAGGDSRIDIDNYTVGSANLSVPPMVAINESDEAANAALTGNIDAVIGRAFTNAYWQTISLPFTLDQEQLKEVFGNGVQVAKLNSSRVASTDNATFELNFEYVSEIEAATPYLIRPSKEVAKGAVVRDVLVDLTPKNVRTTDATMIPVLFKTTFPTAETNYWLAENGYLYGGATDIEAMRAYFTFPNLTAEQASRMRARVVFSENTETSVDNIAIDEAPIKVIQNSQLIIIRNGVKYNVQGQKL